MDFSPELSIKKRAYILDNESNWKIEKGMYLGRIKTDFLTNNLMKIRLSFMSNDGDDYFKIKIQFTDVSNKINFKPSIIKVTFNNEKTIYANGIECSSVRPYAGPQDNQKPSTLENGNSISKGSCYHLFFNHPTPPIEEDIIIYLDDSLTLNGDKLNIPPIYFRKTIEEDYHWGFIM
jgi:hypothetical protein